MRTEQQIQADIAQLQVELEQVRSVWPQKLSGGWFLDSDGDIQEAQFFEVGTDCKHNFFRTKSEAELEHAKSQMRWELAEFARKVNGDWVPDWKNENQRKYNIYYYNTKLCVEYWNLNNYGAAAYFKSKEDAQAAIDHFGDRLKVLFQ